MQSNLSSNRQIAKKQPVKAGNQPGTASAASSAARSFSDKERSKLKQALLEDSDAREQIMEGTRALTKQAKQIIYGIHRNNASEAEKSLEKLKPQIAWLNGKIKKYPNYWGMAGAAFEEYAEAACFLAVMLEQPIPDHEQLGIDAESYLLGICDLSGELMREAVVAATNNNDRQVKRLQAITEEIFGVLLDFDLRNGELRKKADGIKWNLLKIEQVLYDTKLRSK